ncbi:MAG: YnbE family lipoprotein [Desulfobacteraceae bacterium]|nr:YnbE family lipoprotein [Desulfobacteraceae bacterium]MBU4002660.1 hypothetical protein [Pseudomonadota bacterium]MBU4054095.1 hypothetical protein [Pseudomonadota bacterium]
MGKIKFWVAGVYAGLILLLLLPACMTHKVEVAPVKIEPIHITIDVNVKIDRALDDFFGEIDKKAETLEPKPGKAK